MNKRLRAIAAMALTLSGCANYVNHQGKRMNSTPSQHYAGVVFLKADLNGYPVEFVSGKEMEAIEIEATFGKTGLLDGLSIKGDDISAFRGQAIGADAMTRITDIVYSRLSEAGIEVARSVVEGAIRAALVP